MKCWRIVRFKFKTSKDKHSVPPQVQAKPLVTQQIMTMRDGVDRVSSTVFRTAKQTAPVTCRPAQVHALLMREGGPLDRFRFLLLQDSKSGRVSYSHGPEQQRSLSLDSAAHQRGHESSIHSRSGRTGSRT